MKSERPLTGSLQPKNDKYYAVINEYVGGVRKQNWVYTGFKTDRGNKRKAKEFLDKELLKRAEERKRPSRLKDANADMPFMDFMRLWLRMKKKEVTARTCQGYEMMIGGQIKKFFTSRNIQLSDLGPEHIEDFYDAMYDEGITNSTALHFHRLIKQALSYAVKKDILVYNIMDKVDAPKRDAYIADHYSPQEAQRLLSAVKDDTLYIPVLLAVYYGLRRSEVLGLRWRSASFEENHIVIEHKVLEEKVDGVIAVNGYDVMKTTASRRSMPLIPHVAEELKKEKARQDEYRRLFGNEYSKDRNGYVCVDALGNSMRPSCVSARFNKLLKKNGLRHIRFHDLRHTCASMLAAAGVPMKQIQLWLGHSNYSTTADIYSHLDLRRRSSPHRRSSRFWGRIGMILQAFQA